MRKGLIAITGHVHTIELFIMIFPGYSDLPSAIVFLCLEGSLFDEHYDDPDLDSIVIEYKDIAAKIGCVGHDADIVQKVKVALTSMDFSVYRPYAL